MLTLKRRYGSEETKTAARAKLEIATRLPDEITPDMVPDNAIKLLSIDDEKERSNILKTEADDLKTLTAELVALRERANVDGRIKNLNHIKKLDEFIEGVLDKLTSPDMFDLLDAGMKAAIAKGDIKQYKELMVAIGIALDKKNAMIDDSGFTDGRKKNVKIAVNFANNGSTQIGVQMN